MCGALLPALVLWGGGWVYYKVRHREGLGFGDVKLVAMVGSFLGMRGALLTLIIGSIFGSVLGYGYIKATGKDAATYELPFGTFLGAAALAAAIAGPKSAGVVRGAVVGGPRPPGHLAPLGWRARCRKALLDYPVNPGRSSISRATANWPLQLITAQAVFEAGIDSVGA